MKLLLYGLDSYLAFTQRYPEHTAVNFVSILGEISRTQPQFVIDLCTNKRAKRYLVDVLEYLYGTVALYGTPILQDITADLGDPIYVQEHDDPAKYDSTHLVDTITKQYKKTNKVYTNLLPIPMKPGKQAPVTPLEFMALVVYKNKEDNMPSIEESIRAAMLNLGVIDASGQPLPPKDDDPPPAPPAPSPEQPKPAPKPKKAPAAPPPQPKKVVEAPPVEDTQQSDTTPENAAEVPENIYCKIEGGHLALIFPLGLQMEQKKIAGTDVQVLTVELPDWTNDRLQALKVMTPQEQPKAAPAPKPQTKVKRQPIVAPKEAPADVPDADLSGNLADLAMEKQRLTDAIAAARAAGDEALVLQLRKQRRAVRAQINKLKE